MASRLELHEVLCGLLGSRNVYYDPPESVKLVYPCIVYGLNNINNTFANNAVYTSRIGYKVTIIDKDPDSVLIEKMLKLPMCRFDRPYKADNLNHFVFTIYY